MTALAETLAARGPGWEAKLTVVKVGDISLRLLHNGFIPPGVLLMMNDAGWQAFQRGDMPSSTDAVAVRIAPDTAIDQAIAQAGGES